MLRLAPTRISLTPADLDWHVRRHEKRLAKSKNGESTTNKAQASKHRSKSSKHQSARDPDTMPTHSPRKDPVPIFSDEPVPQNSEESQPFWTGILAEIGAAGRGNQTSTFRSHLTDASFENSGAARLSVRRQPETDWSHGSALGDVQISPRSPDSLPQSPASSSGSWTSASTQIQSRQTTNSVPARCLDDDATDQQLSDNSDQELDPEPVAVQGQDVTSQHSRINEMDVDGSSDTGPHLHHHRSVSSLQDFEPGLIGMPFGAQARRAELAASRNASVDSASIHPSCPEPEFTTPEHALQDGYSHSHSLQHMRSRSGGLPRSRLYISEVAASSSPEKRQRSAAGSDFPMVSSNNTGSAPGRVRKKYKRRDSFSFAGSELSDGHSHPTSATYSSENPFRRPPRSSPPEPIPLDSLHYNSSPRSPEHHRDSSFFGSPSVYAHGSSIHSPNHSSYDLPSYDYSSLPRQPFHPLPIPTSSAPRTPSHSNPLTPIQMPTSENASYIRSPYAPTTPASQSSSIGLHPTHISIYNDNLPSHSQPQTPIGLPRNGLPRMYYPNPYYTAPARHGGFSTRRAGVVGNPDVFTSPTRADGGQGLGLIGDGRPGQGRSEQENVSVDVERERREQRQRERGSWTGGRERGWRISEWEP
ncbi:MAG: hypothetical protein LQ337_004075 [Flavoplaca oasis]|nr:MAG: hypothetical protein LQ337_004075 [Flavoplaca oasis]